VITAWRSAALAFTVTALAMTAAPAARGADLWTQTGQSFTSIDYWQGIAFDAGTRSFFFDGPAEGLWRTDAALRQTAGRSTGIPASVTSAQGWNHLGDLSYDGTSGAVLVPLECYYPGLSDPNTCKTGGIGVIDPQTLGWRYYVKLGGITKAMWVQYHGFAQRGWVWTSSGTNQLFAYDAGQVTAAAAGTTIPGHVAGTLPAAGVSGATFWDGRLYLAFDRGSYEQVQSAPVDSTTGDVGTWRPEIQRTKSFGLYETEGLAAGAALGGTLHWQIQPQLPFYTRILHFTS
jgi:phage tail protein X